MLCHQSVMKMNFSTGITKTLTSLSVDLKRLSMHMVSIDINVLWLIQWCISERRSIINFIHYAVCHAAINAILNKNAENLSGCTLYTTHFPSHEDAKMIIQAGIQHVVYYSDEHHEKAFSFIARTILTKAKVWCTRYNSSSTLNKVHAHQYFDRNIIPKLSWSPFGL